MSDARKPYLRVRGELYRRLVARADAEADDMFGNADLADAVSRARIKRVGGGYQVLIPLDPDQIDRIASWAKPNERNLLYQAADELREDLQASVAE